MRNRLLLISLLFFSGSSFAQIDTAYYIKYSDMMGVGVFQSVRNNKISIEKLNVKDPESFHSVNYDINGKDITGFFLDYDKIYFALGFKTASDENDPKKGNTTFSGYAVQLGTNKLILEAGYRKYKGFYDTSTPEYIKPFTDTTLYYQDENLENQNFKIKALYFFNHKKFSYNSSYFGSFRQLKSASSWLLGGSFYYNKMTSDSSFIPWYVRDVFEDYGALNEIRVTGFSLGGGGSVNFVIWKRFFLNLTISLEASPQWRKYKFDTNETTSPFYISGVLDLRSSFGFNSKHFYMLISSTNDQTFSKNKSIVISGSFVNGSVAIGWRFHFENKATKWLKENKIYKMI